MKATEETKALAKAKGIKSWHVKSEERLQDELSKLVETDGRADVGEVSETAEISEPEVDKSSAEVGKEVIKDSDKLTLPCEPEPKLMVWSIKAIGKKSEFYKYRHLLGM